MRYVELPSGISAEPKTELLKKALGVGTLVAVGLRTCLYGWALEHRPDGRLERELLRIACGWEGEEKKLEEALVTAGIVRLCDGVVSVADWETYSRGYRRSRKDAARKRLRRTLREGAARVPEGSAQDQGGELFPVGRADQVLEVFTHWAKVMGKPLAKLTNERRQKILARLREGYSPEDLKKAIDGCRASRFHMGENENGQRYNDLTLILRTGSKLEQFMGYLNNRGPMGGLKHVNGKPSNRYLSSRPEGKEPRGDDPEAQKRLRILKAFGSGAVQEMPWDSQAEVRPAGPREADAS